MADEIVDAISEAAVKPKTASADGVTVSAHPIPDQIEADRYVRSAGGSSKPARGLRFTKLVQPESGS